MKSFWEYYESLSFDEKDNLKNQIIEKTKKTYSTFYSWKRRGKVPRFEQTIIANLLNETVEILFPVIN